jgi:ferric-dicitrate binding protein FerR (iron transport regulator)
MNYSLKSGIVSTRRVDASKLKWMNGELSLNNTTLSEAAQDLERWYDVRINIDNAGARAKNRRFSATFLNHENIDQVMKVLGELSGFNYQRNDNHITIKQR